MSHRINLQTILYNANGLNTMPRTVMELLEEAGGDAEEAVSTACKRWREQVRACVRSLTGLKLTHHQGQGTEQLSVPIRIDPGVPEPLRALESEQIPSNDEWAIELIGLSGHDIERLLSACKDLSPLIGHLRNIPTWGHRAETYGEILGQTDSMGRELAQYAAKAELLKRMVKINEDILGRYGTPGELWPTRGQIELYWLVIGATARLLGVEVEGLTITVLAHEMAHAYTHLGMDLDGKWWENGFWQCDRGVVEGLAQYYTHKVLELLVQRRGNVSGWNAYQAMLAVQKEHRSTLYTNHTEWVKRYSPEVMRAALLDARNSSHQPDVESFTKLLEDTSRRSQRQATRENS